MIQFIKVNGCCQLILLLNKKELKNSDFETMGKRLSQFWFHAYTSVDESFLSSWKGDRWINKYCSECYTTSPHTNACFFRIVPYSGKFAYRNLNLKWSFLRLSAPMPVFCRVASESKILSILPRYGNHSKGKAYHPARRSVNPMFTLIYKKKITVFIALNI